jgi:hypothetical protein
VHTLELPKDDVSGDEKVGRTKALSSLSRQRSSECVRLNAASFICMLVCSKILFMSFGISPGTGARGSNAKNRQPYHNLQQL